MTLLSANQINEIELASLALQQGELVIFPTETVYGIGADAKNSKAVAKLYAAKNRPQFNPLIVHCASTEMAFSLVNTTKLARDLAHAFWPGPLSIILNCTENSPISSLARAGLSSIALRVPANSVCRTLLKLADIPIVAPSANPSGKISPTDIKHLDQALMSKCSHIIDGGRCDAGIESTIIDARFANPVILRPGPITRASIESHTKLPCNSGNSSNSGDSGDLPANNRPDAPIAPGQLASHYAPISEVRINASEKQDGEIYIGFDSPNADYHLTQTGNLEEAASNLFDLLHLADTKSPSRIAVAPIPNIGIGEAINERLARASAPRDFI